jgi:hypothetical protein
MIMRQRNKNKQESTRVHAFTLGDLLPDLEQALVGAFLQLSAAADRTVSPSER